MSLLAGRPPGSRLLPFAAASLGLHLVVAVIAFGASHLSTPRRPPAEDVIKTKLVKLGKERDEKLLPRIDRKKPKPKPKKAPPKREKKAEKKPPKKKPPKKKAPEPEEAPKKAPEPKKPQEPPPEEDSRSAQDILKDFASENQPEDKPKITDLVRDTLDEGSEEGSKIGEEITGRLKATYNDKLLAAVKSALVVPDTIREAERLRLKARLYLAVGADGSVLSARVTQGSGNDLFDNAVVSAAKKGAPYPPPPIQVRDFYASGVQMNVCPISCR